MIISNLNRRRGLSVSDKLSNIDNILKRKNTIQLLYIVFRVPRAKAQHDRDAYRRACSPSKHARSAR